LELTILEQQKTIDELEKRSNDFLEQINSLQNDNQRLMEQIQQYDISLLEKDEAFKIQQDITQQFHQRYEQLEQKYNDQHGLILKVQQNFFYDEEKFIRFFF